jgi:hypothetical protein
MSYATLEQLKAYLKFPSPADPHAEDALLQSFLDEATLLIDAVIGRPSAAAGLTTRTFDAVANVDGRLLLFDCDSVIGITAVTNGDGAAVAAADYATEPRGGGPYWGITLKAGSGISWTYDDDPEGAISVTGYWAHTANANGTADALIVGACRTLAAWMYREKDNVGTLASSADGVTVVSAALPRNVLDRIMARRRLI